MKTVVIIMLGSTMHALLATIISFVVGLPGAYYLARYAMPYRSFVLSACTIASMMPTKLVASSIVFWFHGSGSWAILVAYCMLNIPFVIAVCVNIFTYRDATIEELAYDAGATWYQAYRSVVLPILWPSIISLAGLIFVLCFTNVSIPLILGNNPWHYTCDMMMVECHARGAYDLCALYGALRIIVKAFILYRCTAGGISVIPPLSHAVAVRAIPVSNAGWWSVYWIAVAALLSAPWFTMFRALWQWPQGEFSVSPGVYNALVHSVHAACIGGCIAVLFGYLLLLLSLEKSRSLIALLTMIPFFLGSVGCSIASIVGVRCGIYSPLVAAIICYSIMYYPYVYRILSMHMPFYNPRWHEVARSYGATRWDIQRHHIIPFIRSGLLRAWYLVCVLGVTEVGAGAVLAAEGWITMPVLMREHIAQGQYEQAWALYGLIVLVLLIASLLLFLVGLLLDHVLIFLRSGKRKRAYSDDYCSR